MMKIKVLRNTVLLICMVLAVILVPFFLFHEYIDGWTEQLLKTSGEHMVYTGILLSVLLISDILLPVPSSIVSTGAGFLLGFVNGSIVSFTGMTLGAVLGYALGRGSAGTMKWLDADTRQRMEGFFQRYGKWSIILARPVPVLAEASVFFAGISKMESRSFLLVSALSNLGISLMYAAVGSYSVSVNSFLPAFGGAVILPGIALLFHRRRSS
jgi:uncharacterized membrane protein YdjX (TVP38/TMEM64 family)